MSRVTSLSRPARGSAAEVPDRSFCDSPDDLAANWWYSVGLS
ncbi:hypothetical protein Pd630_LPD02962 [Rhodococcus opacus PD630]|nr:hypothetical protein Pd630_LPD02962 [Rhodococcus opacus PD630]